MGEVFKRYLGKKYAWEDVMERQKSEAVKKEEIGFGELVLKTKPLATSDFDKEKLDKLDEDLAKTEALRAGLAARTKAESGQ